MSARTVCLGPFNVDLVADEPEIAARWDELFAGFPDAGARIPTVLIGIRRATDGSLRSTIDGEHVADDVALAAHELAITRLLNHRKLEAEADLVHFHAAAVARAGRAVVLAGRSGDGKSTLTARLVQLGWEYVTDEQVTLGPDDRTVVPYPRPLTLRRGTWHLFAGIGDDSGGNDYRRVETSLAQIGGTAARGPLYPAVVLAPQYQRGATTSLEPFSDTAAVVEFLASCCHDLGRTGIRGCAALVGLATTCAAFRLRFSDVDAAAARAHEAFARSGERLSPVRTRIDTPNGQPAQRGVVQRAPGSTAWLFEDGSGIAFHPGTMCLARLDTIACALWEVLAEPDSPEAILADSPDESLRAALSIWIDRLVAAGLLVAG